MDNKNIFNEETLRQEIYDTWGENGAHAEVINRVLDKHSLPITEEEIAGIIYKDLRGFLRKHEDCKRAAELCAETLKDRLQSDAVMFAEFLNDNGWIRDPFPRKDFDDDILRYTNIAWADDDNEFKAFTASELYKSEEFKDYKNNFKK